LYQLGFGNDLIHQASTLLLVTNDTDAYLGALATGISTVGLGLSTGGMEPASNIAEYTASVNLAGSQVNLPLFLLYLVSVFLFGALCAYLGITSSRPFRRMGVLPSKGKRILVSELGAMRLKDPATVIHQLFEDIAGGDSNSNKGEELFHEGAHHPRLALGVFDEDAPILRIRPQSKRERDSA
jgi:hypothetical protein